MNNPMQKNNINLNDLHGKRLAMIATFHEDGEIETSVFTGIAHWTGEHLLMLREEDQKPFEVQSEWFDRIVPVKEQIRSILSLFLIFSILKFHPLRAVHPGSGQSTILHHTHQIPLNP